MIIEAPTSAAPPSDVGVLAPSFAASLRDMPLARLMAAASDEGSTAPDPLQALVARRIAAQDAAVDTLDNALRETAGNLAAEIEAYIEGVAGGRNPDAIRAAVASARLEGLIQVVRDAGLDRAEDAYYTKLSSLVPLAERTLGVVGVDDADRMLDGEGARSAIASYLEQDREDFIDAEIAHPSAARILRGLRSSVEAQPLADAARIIARDEGISYERARRAAGQNAAEYDRFVAAEAARQADPEGTSTMWAYTGPDDGLERRFCDRLNGLYLDRQQVGQLDNSQPGVGHPMYACGGYNCRHQWLHGDADMLESLGFTRGADSDVAEANAAAAGQR